MNDDIVVNKLDATFYSKLNILNIYDSDFNKIFPGNLVSSSIIISNSQGSRFLYLSHNSYTGYN